MTEKETIDDNEKQGVTGSGTTDDNSEKADGNTKKR